MHDMHYAYASYDEPRGETIYSRTTVDISHGMKLISLTLPGVEP